MSTIPITQQWRRLYITSSFLCVHYCQRIPSKIPFLIDLALTMPNSANEVCKYKSILFTEITSVFLGDEESNISLN